MVLLFVHSQTPIYKGHFSRMLKGLKGVTEGEDIHLSVTSCRMLPGVLKQLLRNPHKEELPLASVEEFLALAVLLHCLPLIS